MARRSASSLPCMPSTFELTRLAVLALAAGAGGWLLGRRRAPASGRTITGPGDGVPARLEADLDAMRALLRDFIADRENTEDALRADEARYRLLFEHSPRPVWVYDTTTLRFLAVNDAAVRRYGWSREEFLAMTVADLHAPEELPAIRDAVSRLDVVDRESEWRHRSRD